MIQRYDLTYDVASDDFAVTPVPESHEGRFVAYEDYESLLKLNESLTKEIEQYHERIKVAEDVIKLFSEAVEKYKERNVPIKEEAWTVWLGGENPAPGEIVEYKLRNGGDKVLSRLSDHLHWGHIGALKGSDIIAYRVVKEG
ncbi:hypothetical protein F13_0018 [Escherichia phage F13]|uniref:Uncharacterized protein n=1 Tax=Escherichia phage vB_EcoM_SP13 TaxID=2981577 RepID=A0A9X9JRT4_9CAUD|nr:hypothetical protein SP13_102 [Escherichia phage vB_EcoM_SP13]WAQ79394.1 hypothetical protein F13_0018 [Escherichia phage F13]